MIERFGVYLVTLDPTVGYEMSKTRPCVVVSPEEMNRYLRTVMVAPLTSARRTYPSRVGCRFQGKQGEVVLDQLRTVDRSRLVKRLGTLDANTSKKVVETLLEIFR